MTVTEAERFAVRRPSSAPYPTPALDVEAAFDKMHEGKVLRSVVGF
tara:strand:+ start:230 stop:367 length:138 start_codon:yes stop_codon:yes gene_type:complete